MTASVEQLVNCMGQHRQNRQVSSIRTGNHQGWVVINVKQTGNNEKRQRHDSTSTQITIAADDPILTDGF